MSSQKIIKKRFNYTENDFKSAVQYCKAGGKLSSAAKLHNIPVSTLSRKLNAGIDYVTKPGRKPWICRQTEENLAEWITEGGVLGAPKSRSDIKLAAWGLSSKNSDEKGGNFGSSGPSNGWLNKFFRRHPEIKKRKAEGLSSASAAVNFHNIQGWFSFVQDWLITNGFFDILNDPSRIINMDEAGFEHYPSSGMVFVHKSQKDVYNVARNAKEQTTVLWAFQASGEALKPHIVFAGKRLTNELKTATPDSVTIGLTESGWMTQVHFAHYLENILVPQLRAKGVQFPVIVFLDGHSSHDSIEIAEKSKSLGIILIRLYPNSTHIYQPADRGIFHPIKSYYNRAIKMNKLTDTDFNVNKKTFPHLMEKCFNMLDPDTVRTAFETCGIYPWDASSIGADQ